MTSFESGKFDQESGEGDIERQLESEAKILDGNTSEVAAQLREVNPGNLTLERQQSLLSKAEMVVGSVFGALGVAGVGTFAYEVWNKKGFDTPEKALITMGIFLGGLASAKVGEMILDKRQTKKIGV